MKIIDLLIKFNNGEIDNKAKFWWNGCIHEIEIDSAGKYSIFDTYCKIYKKIELDNLNDEIKIIEEDKKIEYEQIKELTCGIYDFEKKTINSLIKNQRKLIDEINKLKEND